MLSCAEACSPLESQETVVVPVLCDAVASALSVTVTLWPAFKFEIVMPAPRMVPLTDTVEGFWTLSLWTVMFDHGLLTGFA